MRTLCYFLVFVLFSLSCTKFGKNVTVRGRVINYVTGEGIADQEIKLLRGGGGYNGGFKLVKNTYTDANGEYEIEKLGLNTYYIQHNTLVPMYDVGKIKNGEFVNPGISQIKIKKGKNQSVDFLVVPYGLFLSHYKNESCISAGDSMRFRKRYQLDTDYGNWSTWRLGCYEFEATETSELPMGIYYYETEVRRSGMVLFIYDTLYIPENGIGNLEIFY